MDPITAMALANIGGGLLGDLFSSGDRGASEDQIREILKLYQNLKVPTIEEQSLDLGRYQSAGNLNPETNQAEDLSAVDNLQNVQTDPRLRQAQMNALKTLSQIGGSGFTPDELNAALGMQEQNNADLTSRMKQLQQQQDVRGIGTSNMALAQKMMEAQSGANRAAADARNLQSEAFKRSLSAITSGGEMAGGIEAQDYGRAKNVADSLNRREFTNVQNRNSINESNVDRFNRALEYNLNNQQGIMNKNVDTSNQQQAHNKGLQQTNFQNQMDRIGGMAGGYKGMGDMYADRAAGTAKKWAGIGSGAGQMIMGGTGPTVTNKMGMLDYDKDLYGNALQGGDDVRNAARKRKP